MERTFSNDKERREFLEDHYEAQGWSLWKQLWCLPRRWWRCDIGEGLELIVEEEEMTLHFPEERREWRDMRWYMAPKNFDIIDRPISDYQISKTQALDKIKELDRIRKGKEKKCQK